MIGRLKLGIITTAAALFVAPTLTGVGIAAQESGRVRVLVPDLFPAEGANKNFGRDVAKELRDHLSGLPTHTAVEKGDIEDSLDQFKLKMDQLNCTTTRQLGSQMRLAVALCATYSESGDDRVFEEIKFVDLNSSQEFAVEGFTIHKDRKKEAAERIVQAFDAFVQQARNQRFCVEYAQSSDWEGSLRNCDLALEMNAADEVSLYQRAFTLWKMDRLEDARTQIDALLEKNPYHDDGLQLGGFLALTLDDKEQGRVYYSRYLELNPGADDVRRNIAYDMFEAGDPEGAMLLIEEGLAQSGTELEDANTDLLADLGNYAFEAARRSSPESAQSGEGEITPEARALFAKAIDAFTQVYEEQGDSMGVAQLRNVVLARVQLGELDEAQTFAERVLETHDQEAGLWSTYATVLERQDDIEGAAEALARIESIDPDFQRLHLRRAALYLRGGQRDRALPIFRQAVEQGEDPNVIADQIFADAYQKGFNTQNAQRDVSYGIAGVEAAKQYEVTAETMAKFDFWHAYGLFQQGMARQEARTVETAQATLPLFQQARRLFQEGAAYAATEPSINIDQFLEATDSYIEIQEAIIRRGR
jgi:tetratricopeptide (TPR) repeat protein